MSRTTKRGWLVVVVVLVVLAFVLPFTIFRDVHAWYGSFLFWCLAAAAVIGINAVVSSDWRD